MLHNSINILTWCLKKKKKTAPHVSCFVPSLACLFIASCTEDDRMMPGAKYIIHCSTTHKAYYNS